MADSPVLSTEPSTDTIFDAVAAPIRIRILEALWTAEDQEATSLNRNEWPEATIQDNSITTSQSSEER